MFDWLFRPTCPCDPSAKAWVVERLEWLADEFDDNAFAGRPIVLPTPEFFPDAYDGSKRSVRKLLDRVCEYMDVVPSLVALKFVADAGKLWLVNDVGQYLPHAAGTNEEGEEKFIVRIDESELHNAMGLVGTIALELAHVRSLGCTDRKKQIFARPPARRSLAAASFVARRQRGVRVCPLRPAGTGRTIKVRHAVSDDRSVRHAFRRRDR